jgi:hypothetical protein
VASRVAVVAVVEHLTTASTQVLAAMVLAVLQ